MLLSYKTQGIIHAQVHMHLIRAQGASQCANNIP